MSFYDREPFVQYGPAAGSGDAGRRMWCRVLPCSRSCWSYHGSSSSVMNSSILPEFSMGLSLPHRERPQRRRASSVGNNGAPAGARGPPEGSSRSFKAELRSGFLRPSSVVLWLDVFLLVPPLSAVSTPTSPSHPPNAQHRAIPVFRPAPGSDRRGRHTSSLRALSRCLQVRS